LGWIDVRDFQPECWRRKKKMNQQFKELLLQSLETEMGGVQVYQTALRCVVNKDLKKEWKEYLEQTKRHVEVMHELFETFGLDSEKMTPGRKVVRHIGESLVKAMEMALKNDKPEAAELVACECVVLAETKDHANWQLISQYAENAKGEEAKALKEACEEVEVQEDEHLYHSKGWSRELWIASLGMRAVLPPPEEKKDVKTAIGAARAQQSRKAMLKKRGA
jgi:ferritin-like metal-binding protein YciE